MSEHSHACFCFISVGEYEYIDVVFDDGQLKERLIVDVDFQVQFEIARPTQQYEAALKILPAIFVGSTSKLQQILEFMSEAAKAYLETERHSISLRGARSTT